MCVWGFQIAVWQDAKTPFQADPHRKICCREGFFPPALDRNPSWLSFPQRPNFQICLPLCSPLCLFLALKEHWSLGTTGKLKSLQNLLWITERRFASVSSPQLIPLPLCHFKNLKSLEETSPPSPHEPDWSLQLWPRSNCDCDWGAVGMSEWSTNTPAGEDICWRFVAKAVHLPRQLGSWQEHPGKEKKMGKD